MAENKNKKITDLEDKKLSPSTMKVIAGVDIPKTGDEVVPHDAVQKMNTPNVASISKKDQKVKENIENVRQQLSEEDQKLKALIEKNQQQTSSVRLEHELLLEASRKEVKRKDAKALNKEDLQKANDEAAKLFEAPVPVAKKAKADKGRSIEDMNREIDEKTATGKVFKIKTQKPKAKVLQDPSKGDFRTDADIYFAKKQGWIEDDSRQQWIQSPLNGYADKTITHDENILEEELTALKADSISRQIDQTLFEEEFDTISLREIEQMAKRFEAEAREANAMLRKQQYSAEATSQDLKEVYQKVLDKSNIEQLKQDEKVSTFVKKEGTKKK